MRASIWHLLVAAAPVVGVLVYVSQSNRQDVVLRQERAEVQLRLDRSQFDRDFAVVWSGQPLAVDASVTEKMKVLEVSRDALDRQLSAGMSSAQSDLADLRRELERLDQTPGGQK